jgi:DNA-binding transcriptional LysR family regulator
MIEQSLRLLDVDDLIILSRLAHGDSQREIALVLRLTQPAICQRMRKMEAIFGAKITKLSGKYSVLTERGKQIAETAKAALNYVRSTLAEYN